VPPPSLYKAKTRCEFQVSSLFKSEEDQKNQITVESFFEKAAVIVALMMLKEPSHSRFKD